MYVKITMCLLLYCVARTDATCPEVKIADNLNITAFGSGVWYNIARYANHFEKADGCIATKHSLIDGVFRIDSIDAADTDLHFVAAFGKVEADGKISLKVENGYIRSIFNVSLTIMFTDNDKYAVLYDCIHENDHYKESFWIVAKTKTLADEDKETIFKYLKSSDIIDPNRLLWLDNSDERCQQLRH